MHSMRMIRVPQTVDWCERQCVQQQCSRQGKFAVESVPEDTEVPNDNTARDFTINHSNVWYFRPCFPQQSCPQGKNDVGSVPASTGVPNDNCACESTVRSFYCCGAMMGCEFCCVASLLEAMIHHRNPMGKCFMTANHEKNQ